jgi:hypothetical protein
MMKPSQREQCYRILETAKRDNVMRLVYRSVVLALLIAITISSYGCAGRNVPKSEKEPIETPAAVAAQADRTVMVDGCGYGSGVMISPTAVLTARHVVFLRGVDHPCMIVIEYPDGTREDATVDLESTRLDVVRLKTKARREIQAPKSHAVTIWETVCIVSGHPERDASCGRAVHFSSGFAGIMHTARTIPGNSGSGLWNRRGELLGIVVTYSNYGGNASPVPPVWLTEGTK